MPTPITAEQQAAHDLELALVCSEHSAPAVIRREFLELNPDAGQTGFSDAFKRLLDGKLVTSAVTENGGQRVTLTAAGTAFLNGKAADQASTGNPLDATDGDHASTTYDAPPQAETPPAETKPKRKPATNGRRKRKVKQDPPAEQPAAPGTESAPPAATDPPPSQSAQPRRGPDIVIPDDLKAAMLAWQESSIVAGEDFGVVVRVLIRLGLASQAAAD